MEIIRLGIAERVQGNVIMHLSMLTEAWMMALTSNSSQKPCLTLSVASAGLLSSRTLLSISAALMRVVLRGFKYNRRDVYNKPTSNLIQNGSK